MGPDVLQGREELAAVARPVAVGEEHVEPRHDALVQVGVRGQAMTIFQEVLTEPGQALEVVVHGGWTHSGQLENAPPEGLRKGDVLEEPAKLSSRLADDLPRTAATQARHDRKSVHQGPGRPEKMNDCTMKICWRRISGTVVTNTQRSQL